MITHPLIIAHRGARKYAPENTLPAFKKAIELKVDGVEFDVLSTLDGLPVVVHDDNLLKLTGRHLSVSKTGYNELLSLDFGNHFNPYFSGEKISTLKEVLELFADTNILLNIELKAQPHQHRNFLKHVAETIDSVILKSAKNPPNIIISSFSPLLLYKIKKLLPDVRQNLLVRSRAFYFLQMKFFANMLNVNGINPHISILSERMMKFARKKGLGVITWTCNSTVQAQKAALLGVDGIITDDPVLVKEIINRSSTL